MLIIFDLDDTLVDTSGCVTRPKLESALRAMQRAGLHVPDFAHGLALLQDFNEHALSAKVALTQLVEVFGGGGAILEKGIREVYESGVEDLTVSPLEGASAVLSILGQSHTLALVSVGIPTLQMQKLKKAGIDSACFSKILITQQEDKTASYKQILSELEVPQDQVLVCGDRIARDLAPAKELGCVTVLMRWGRGRLATLPSPAVDYVISSLTELEGIVQTRSF